LTSRREAALKRALEGGVHDVERKAFRGGATTLVSQGLRMLLQFGSVAALARLLTPRQFGLFGMVAFVTGFVALINDLGLNAATVQRQNLQERQVSALFWVNLGFSAACTLLMMAGAPLIALVFKEPSLTWVAIALAPTFVIAGATAQHGALLARCLDFGRLAAVDLAPFALGVAAAVGAAAAGLGVWALVIQQLVFGLMRSALILAFMPWLPSRPHFGEEERAMLRFGGNVSGFRIVNFLARNLDNALIGWYWGAPTLAVYSRAYALFMAPMSNIVPAVRQVMETTLSRVQSDEARFVKMYERSEETMAWLIFPLSILALVAAKPVVAVLLGPQWGDVVPVLRLLSIASLVQPVLASTGWLFTATGRGQELLRWGLLNSIACCVGFAVAVPFGNIGMALAAAGVRVALAPIGLRMAMRGTPLTIPRMIWELRHPLLATGSGALLALLAQRLLLGKPELLRLIAATASMYVCVIAVLVVTGRSQSVLGMLRRRPAAADQPA
jgi:PST family polysaccharide transporter